MTVILSLLNLETPVDGYKELVNAAFEIMSKNLDSMHQNKILLLIKTCRTQAFYHSKFLFTVADTIVCKKWNFEYTYLALTHFYKMDFCPSILLDHFAEVLCSEYEVYKSNNFYSPLNCVEYLTSSSYQPAHVDEAVRLLYTHEAKLEYLLAKQSNLAVKFLSSLAILGHFPPYLLSKTLDEDYLFSAWSSSKKQGKIFFIYNA